MSNLLRLSVILNCIAYEICRVKAYVIELELGWLWGRSGRLSFNAKQREAPQFPMPLESGVSWQEKQDNTNEISSWCQKNNPLCRFSTGGFADDWGRHGWDNVTGVWKQKFGKPYYNRLNLWLHRQVWKLLILDTWIAWPSWGDWNCPLKVTGFG